MQLIRQAEPRHVVLVHGEKAKMGFLKQKILKEFGIPCFDPANGTTVGLPTSQAVSVDISVNLLKRTLEPSDIDPDGERAGNLSFFSFLFFSFFFSFFSFSLLIPSNTPHPPPFNI